MSDIYRPMRQETPGPANVPVYGRLPDRQDRQRVLLLYANTRTEKRILSEFAESIIAAAPDKNKPRMAWFNDANDRDYLEHDGLVGSLEAAPSLDIIPIGAVWRPATLEQLTWRQIRDWMKLVDNNNRQARALKKSPDRCAIIIGQFGTQSALKAKLKRLHEGLPEADNNDTQALANYVALQAAVTIERDSRAVTGQSVKYPRFVMRSIWARPAFQQQLVEIAKSEKRSLESVKEEARVCLRELIPKVRAPHVSLSTQFAKSVSRLGYDEDLVYDPIRMEMARDTAATRPTALVWTHKTHIDGFAMMLATRAEGFPLVHVIGGSNMAFFGVGYLMRRAGTVFIRRSIDSVVYKLVLRSYIGFLLQKRFPVSWALEGTRSRNGKLMPPRFGILKYVVEAAANLDMQDLSIIPISIYYDLIAELGDYATEQTGKTKRKESLAWFSDYLRSLRKPLGRISLGIGDAVTVDTTTRAFKEAHEGGDESFSVELQKLAFEASVSANNVTPITPSSLISLVLTGAAPQALTRDELTSELWLLRDWANARNLPMTKELLDQDHDRVLSIANDMIEIGVVSRYDDGEEPVYKIAEGKHFEASYYRNNAIHFFVEKAIIEVALMQVSNISAANATTSFWEQVHALRDTFKFEFFYPDTHTFDANIEAEMDRINADWKAIIASGHAQTLLDGMDVFVSHAVLRPFTEAYSIIANLLKKRSPAAGFDEKSVVNDALKIGKQAFLQRRITSEESIGKLMFSNGYKLALNKGLIPNGTVELTAAHANFAREFSDLAQDLRYIGEIDAVRRHNSSHDTPVRSDLRLVRDRKI